MIHLLATSAIGAAHRATLFAAVLEAFFVLALAEFGQREHLMLMLMLMLALGDLGPRAGWGERISIGLTAARGLMLKPYFTVIPAGIILARLARDRQWQRLFDLPNLVIGIALLSYVGLIVLVHPAYLNEIVPPARLVYAAYDGHPLAL
ncbi:hypothetical protein [Blastomonas fulva]|uniref:hypothetical protein n=1 Tax=Blastomonas fulva TaxID=1550728 RepID=UPI003F6FEE93